MLKSTKIRIEWSLLEILQVYYDVVDPFSWIYHHSMANLHDHYHRDKYCHPTLIVDILQHAHDHLLCLLHPPRQLQDLHDSRHNNQLPGACGWSSRFGQPGRWAILQGWQAWGRLHNPGLLEWNCYLERDHTHRDDIYSVSVRNKHLSSCGSFSVIGLV